MNERLLAAYNVGPNMYIKVSYGSVGSSLGPDLYVEYIEELS